MLSHYTKRVDIFLIYNLQKVNQSGKHNGLLMETLNITEPLLTLTVYFSLKIINFIICIPLSKNFNLCITTGYHPQKLKLAHVIPIFKKGCRLLVSNYRPISLLSNINKIFEKIMHSRIYSFLEKYQLL